MNQASLFDLPTALDLRDRGIERAADRNGRMVHTARQIALDICKEKGTATMDDVMEALIEKGHGAHCLGNAAGGIFRDKRFEFTGQWITSKRVWSRGNQLRVWRLSAEGRR